MKLSLLILAGCLLVLLCGCGGPQGAGAALSPAEQIEMLNEQKTELTAQLEESNVENERLKSQVEVLSELPADVRVDKLYHLKRVTIGKYTGFYDKDRDGRKEKLIVYLEPTDETGDCLKAAGVVEVQLWDLNNDAQPLLGKWRVGADELKEMWFSTFLKNNYRLIFDISEVVENFTEPLTVKVSFVDYLSGRALTDQKVIEP